MKTISTILFLLIAIYSYSQDSITPKTNKQGVYTEYLSYILGKASIPEGFTIDTTKRKNYIWQGTYSFVPSNNNGPMTEVWGFCDGNYNYINFRNRFYKIFKENENYVVYAFEDPDMSGTAMAIYEGGLIKGAVNAGSAYLESRKFLHKFYIDPYTGNLVASKDILDFFDIENRYSDLIIYRQSDNDSNKPINFSVNDSLSFSFPPYSYVKLTLPLRKEPYRISFDSKITNEKYIFLDIDKTLYLKCKRFEHDDDIIIFQDVKDQVYGAAEASNSRKIQEKRRQKKEK